MPKVVTVKSKELTPKLATQFGRLKATRKELEKEEKALIPKIKVLMQDEEEDVVVTRSEGMNGKVKTFTYGPPDSPYMLEFQQYEAVDVSWKDQFEVFYIELYGQKAFAKFLEKLPLKTCDKLDAKVNPNYKGGQ